MGKIIVKTFEEIDREWPPERIRALVASGVRSFPDDVTDEDIATGRVRDMPGRGFEEIMRLERERILKMKAAARSEPAPGATKIKTGARLPEPAAV